MKTKTRKFRLTESQDRKLEELAEEAGFQVSQFIRRQLGLEGAGFGEPQAKAEGLAGSTRGSVPSVSTDKEFTRLVKQLEAQGKPDPEGEARRRLGM